MVTQRWGDFLVSRYRTSWGPEMMLHSRGGYTIRDGMADIGADMICFYVVHPIILTFDYAFPIIRGEVGDKGIKSQMGGQSQVWDYELQALRPEEREQSMAHWSVRWNSTELTQWDWWEVALDRSQRSSMTELARQMNIFNAQEGHTYHKIHFLCCRSWMGKGKAPTAFGLDAPTEKLS